MGSGINEVRAWSRTKEGNSVSKREWVRVAMGVAVPGILAVWATIAQAQMGPVKME